MLNLCFSFPGTDLFSRHVFQVYGGEARISTLRKLFPLMEDKKSLASSEERAQIKGKASLLAAVDYYVGMHSNIFISASPGNMHNALVSTYDVPYISTLESILYSSEDRGPSTLVHAFY